MDKQRLETEVKRLDYDIDWKLRQIAKLKRDLNRLKRWRRAAKSKLKEGSNG